MFYEATINPSAAGFGEYQMGEANGEGWISDSDLFAEIANSRPDYLILEFGKDDLPAGVGDIRGRIHYQEGRIFVVLPTDGGQAEGPTYFAIVERP